MKTELVTSLKRRAAEIIAELNGHGETILITQHGKPAAYLMDVGTFESMARRVSILEGIARGERALGEGRILSHAKAKSRMKRWLK